MDEEATSTDAPGNAKNDDPDDDRVSRSPFRDLQVIAAQQVSITPDLEHLELYTLGGLLTILWHGDPEAECVVVMVGGAMGGLLGPADGRFHDLGTALVAEGISTMRVSYRKPNDLGACTHDLAAACDLAARRGARRFILMGHSFGGAIALRTALMINRHCAGVATFATQSAGCELVDQLADDVPVLLFHGDQDELLPVAVSEMVRMLVGHGELVVLEGNGHLLSQAGDQLRERLLEWVPSRFADHRDRSAERDGEGGRG
jgi:acetyl esterase/lipase